ncbi:MAG: fatty acid desaturase [Myxococcota bacterium]
MSGATRSSIRRALPASTFTPRPLRALLIPMWATLSTALIGVIVFAGLPWWADLGLGLLLAQTFAGGAFVAHEVLHGSTVKNRLLQDVLGWVGFLPFLVSPTLWREWHNRRHHSHANQGVRDPDAFGDAAHYAEGGPRRFSLPLLPGSGTVRSYFFLFYWFTFHNLVILFLMSRKFSGFKRRPAIVHTVLAAAVWGVVLAFAGWESAFAIFLPMALANSMVMGYIATNHMLRPETRDRDVVETTMSVRVPWLVDVLHGNFSHHIEHHLFPSMNPSQAPAVRRWMQDHESEAYIAPPLHTAISWLYRTPRTYKDKRTLMHPDRPEVTVDLDAMADILRDADGRPRTREPGQAA